MNRPSAPRAALMVALALLCQFPASAMTIKEFRKFSQLEQGTYIGAAVSMLAYAHAANGEAVKGRCILNWYFGKKGIETPGPRQITVELAVAGDADAEKYQVEGVILGLTDKVCGGGASGATRPKP